MPTARTQTGSVFPRNLPWAISGQYDESAFLVASNQFGDPWGLNVDGVVSLFVPSHGTQHGSSSSENGSRLRSAAVYTNKDSVMLKIASWTALFYGLLLLLCCAVHADNAIGTVGIKVDRLVAGVLVCTHQRMGDIRCFRLFDFASFGRTPRRAPGVITVYGP